MTAKLKGLLGRKSSRACACELHDDVVCVAQACCRRCVKAVR